MCERPVRGSCVLKLVSERVVCKTVVPRLPRKRPRRQKRPRRTKHGTKSNPVPKVPQLPWKTQRDVTKCHVCHANATSMSPSATPATQKQLCVCDKVELVCDKVVCGKVVCDKVVCDKVVCVCVRESCV